MKRFLYLALPSLLFTGFLFGSEALRDANPRHIIYVNASGSQYTVDELMEQSDAIAIVVATGNAKDHWNNMANAQWSPSPGSGRSALIVRDNELLLVRTLRGSFESGDSVRTIGGTAAGVQMVFEGEPILRAGKQYILFLQAVDWPTQEGVERVFAPVAEGQGIFSATVGGSYTNAAGITLASSFLTE